MLSGRSTIEKLSGQKLCDPITRSSARSSIASLGVMVWCTIDGLHDNRTNPDSVKGHVAHP